MHSSNDSSGNFGRSIALRGPDMMRSRTFEQIAIATSHLRLGNRELGLRIGRQALDAAANVRSIRTVDRLSPLRDAACRHTTDRELQDMGRGIEELQASV